MTPPQSAPRSPDAANFRTNATRSKAYSAAETNFGFGLLADNMKSEILGTISDLKREPLNTP
jgi:uncharacterized protein GlcG (DUF336 family)